MPDIMSPDLFSEASIRQLVSFGGPHFACRGIRRNDRKLPRLIAPVGLVDEMDFEIGWMHFLSVLLRVMVDPLEPLRCLFDATDFADKAINVEVRLFGGPFQCQAAPADFGWNVAVEMPNRYDIITFQFVVQRYYNWWR